MVVRSNWAVRRQRSNKPNRSLGPVRFVFRFSSRSLNPVMTRFTILQNLFTQTDPMPADVGSAYPSAYMYGNNDPVSFVDPSGLRGSSIGRGPGILALGSQTGPSATYPTVPPRALPTVPPRGTLPTVPPRSSTTTTTPIVPGDYQPSLEYLEVSSSGRLKVLALRF
jgi:hypothetical protein